jgi:hypothetical protein
MIYEWNIHGIVYYFNATTEWLYLARPESNEELGEPSLNMFRFRNDGTGMEIVYKTVH